MNKDVLKKHWYRACSSMCPMADEGEGGCLCERLLSMYRWSDGTDSEFYLLLSDNKLHCITSRDLSLPGR